MEDTTRFSITWMCNGCGQFGVLLRPPNALFQEVLADSNRRHHLVSPACACALMLDSEVAILPARTGVLEWFFGRMELPVGLTILVVAVWIVRWWWHRG